jgi:hypothetical protein
MTFFDKVRTAMGALGRTATAGTPVADAEAHRNSSERGRRVAFDEQIERFKGLLWVDMRLLQTLRDIREMDRSDGRVKKIHGRSARAAAKGGVRLVATGQPRLEREWRQFALNVRLNNPQKLISDLRGLMMDGHLALQWVLSDTGDVVAAPRMPPESLRANVNDAGVFVDPRHAYEQVDMETGQVLARFGLWQLSMGRLDPLNFDDWGSPGRPYLDATRGVWKKLVMTEEDAVLRRHMRAPQRMSHVLEGASPEDLLAYKDQVEQDQSHGAVRDYYLNKKGAVTPIAGDANLDQIADVVHLLDTFAAGSPMPKGLFGYLGEMSRDILEDIKRDWYDELAAMQMVAASVYEQGFRLHLLLRGINPNAYDFHVAFAERLTDSPNQRADLALKQQALGASRETVYETAGLNATQELKAIKRERATLDPYPEDVDEGDLTPPGVTAPASGPLAPGTRPRISVTPGNAPKGESAVSITNN